MMILRTKRRPRDPHPPRRAPAKKMPEMKEKPVRDEPEVNQGRNSPASSETALTNSSTSASSSGRSSPKSDSDDDKPISTAPIPIQRRAPAKRMPEMDEKPVRDEPTTESRKRRHTLSSDSSEGKKLSRMGEKVFRDTEEGNKENIAPTTTRSTAKSIRNSGPGSSGELKKGTARRPTAANKSPAKKVQAPQKRKKKKPPVQCRAPVKRMPNMDEKPVREEPKTESKKRRHMSSSDSSGGKKMPRMEEKPVRDTVGEDKENIAPTPTRSTAKSIRNSGQGSSGEPKKKTARRPAAPKKSPVKKVQAPRKRAARRSAKKDPAPAPSQYAYDPRADAVAISKINIRRRQEVTVRRTTVAEVFNPANPRFLT